MIKPPPTEEVQKTKQKEKEIEQRINKGAPVKEEEKEKWKLVPIRLPGHLLKNIDHCTKKRIGLSRNAWILEAVQEKITRE